MEVRVDNLQFYDPILTQSIGGKHFSKNLRPLDADGNEVSERNPNEEDAEEEESSEEESSEEEEDPNKPALTREQRRAAAKAKKEAAIAKKKGVPQPGDMPSSSEEESSDEDDDMPANPNHSKAARNQAKAAPVSVDEATEAVKDMSVNKGKKPVAELSRREREALQAQQAKERYQKLHEAGKTDEAKADLARLKLIREKREAEAARKQVCDLLCRLVYLLIFVRPRRRSVRSPRSRRRQKLMHGKQREEKLLWGLQERQRKGKARSKAVFDEDPAALVLSDSCICGEVLDHLWHIVILISLLVFDTFVEQKNTLLCIAFCSLYLPKCILFLRIHLRSACPTFSVVYFTSM